MKKKGILIALLFSVSLGTLSAQDDGGFGDEGGGNAADAPAAVPINKNLTLRILSGVLLAGYYFVFKQKK